MGDAMEEGNECLLTLRDRVQCRKVQMDTLLNLFGKRSDVTYPCVFVYGLSSTGKTFTVASILQSMKFPHTIVKCVECLTAKLLYEITLNQVSRVHPNPANEYTNFVSCDNANDFVRNLRKAMESRNVGTDETYYIILDRAEYLRQLDSTVLSVFMRLQEFMKMNLCVIMISEIVWEKVRPSTGLCEPVEVHFPQYSKDDVCYILSRDPPDGYSRTFYENYLRVVLSVFHMVCCNLVELRYLARQNFAKYVEPIEKGLALESNAQKLWRNIEPQLKLAMNGVYMRESVESRSRAQGMVCDATSKNRVELPFYSKYLLIAAYLASYNPMSTDKRFFLKKHDKVGKKAKANSMKRHEKVTRHLLGPKVFPLDRLLAIFYSIVEDRVSPSAHIYSQISTLVTLNLMTQVGKEQLDSPKYRCNVALDFIRSVARTVDFDVVKYLYDFV